MGNANLGQYFTKDIRLQSIVFSLVRNLGSFLEPSSGEGHLVSYFEQRGIKNITSIEYDETIQSMAITQPLYLDFFDYHISNKFDTIFGNPPFVRFRNIDETTKSKLNIDTNLSSCNLFYYFIEKSFYHLNSSGEMIFIVPRELLNSTRAQTLRKLLFDYGTITDIYDFGEAKFFEDAAPNIIIFRYEKDNLSHTTNCYSLKSVIENLIYNNLVYDLDSYDNQSSLSNFFDVKVGLVTGCNEVYERDSKFSIPTICSDYRQTKLKRNIVFVDEYSIEEIRERDEELFQHLIRNKEQLISRRIKKFNESNWFCYGAVRNIDVMRKSGKALYVNSKTRKENPFFVEDLGYFDGSILCLVPKNEELDLIYWCNKLNTCKKEFKAQNMYVNNKYIFSVRALSDFKVPLDK